MAGLDPAIHAFLARPLEISVEARIKSGHDGWRLMGMAHSFNSLHSLKSSLPLALGTEERGAAALHDALDPARAVAIGTALALLAIDGPVVLEISELA